MLIMSYICIGLSLLLLMLIIQIIKSKEKKQRLRYHGITKKRRGII